MRRLWNSSSERKTRIGFFSLGSSNPAVGSSATSLFPSLNEAEEREVKDVAKELLQTLKDHRLVLDWRKRQQSRAAVWVTVGEVLDRLPRAYTTALYEEKCGLVYQHVFEAYAGAGGSVYGALSL